MKREKELLQSLIDRRTTNSYTKKEREALITLSNWIEPFDDGSYLVFLFKGVRDIRIYLKCDIEEEYAFTYISIPNQKIIKSEMPDEV